MGPSHATRSEVDGNTTSRLMATDSSPEIGAAPFNGLIFVENWFQELKERVPVP